MTGSVARSETLPIRTEDDVVFVRKAVRQYTTGAGFGIVDQTKLVTAASELARNTLVHAGGGSMTLDVVTDGGRTGVRLTFHDDGPGIAAVERALAGGYSSNGGMGLGLSGARRLVEEFDLRTAPGAGTTVIVARWKR